MPKIVPLHDKIVVEVVESTKTSAGGILLISTVDNFTKAKVVAVSKGYYVGKKFHTLDVEVGDVVLMQKSAGSEVKVDGSTFRIVREEEIMAIER